MKSPSLRFWCGSVLQIIDLLPDSQQFTDTVMVSLYKKDACNSGCCCCRKFASKRTLDNNFCLLRRHWYWGGGGQCAVPPTCSVRFETQQTKLSPVLNKWEDVG